jgi:GTP pyrophosphokinase
LTARDTGPLIVPVPRAPEGPAAGSISPLPPGYAEAGILAGRVATYDPRADVGLITRAGQLAAEAHAAQQRENGEPYITHPLAVAGILADYRLDSATIATALLHDVAEDTAIGLKEIERQFGAEVARLVDGVTKLTRIELQSERTKQAENLRKLVLAMSEDIRVLLVKLADRLHNMRTLHFVPQVARRQKTARETLEIFTPLAERIGMDALKTELETLAFQALHPEARQTIAARLTFLRGQGADLIREIEQDLRRVLASHGITAVDVMGREKSPYSIWLKMQRKNVAFEALSDVMAFRVIVEDRAACYVALGAVHDAYRVVPGRFKDYISTPKTNGYQSLHTGVTVPARRNAKIEVQIRTREMHEVAEYGVAAHWIYKQGPEVAGSPMARKRYPWVRALLDILENAEGAQEFLDDTKLELHRELVFCFSPKGDLIELPRGATPVDFAYEVHSQVGDNCVGAKVNGKIVPLRHKLENGDQVEIITARGGQPNPAWERFVVTGKARARIRRFIHARQREEYQENGRSAITKAFRQEGLDVSEKLLEGALKALKQSGLNELYLAVGSGSLAAREVVQAAVPELRTPPRIADALPLARPRGRLGAGPLLGRLDRPGGRAAAVQASMPVTGLVSGMPYHFAGCCHPLPGERILGIVTTGKGVTIHAADCRSLENFAAAPERFLDIDWDDSALGGHVGRIIVETRNRPSALASLTETVAQQDGVVAGLKVNHRDPESCEISLDVEVNDLRHLERIMGALRAPADNLRVERARS